MPMIRPRSPHRGFTMIEVFAVLVIIGMLIMLLLPAVQASREAARRTSCANNFMQIGVAIQGYHAAFKQLPTQLSGTDGSATKDQDNNGRLSFLVALLPFVDQPGLWEQIQSEADRTDVDEYGIFDSYEDAYEDAMGMELSMSESDAESAEPITPWVAGGPPPYVMSYGPWRNEVPYYRCPSDPGIGDSGRTNYAACLGDGLMAADSGPMKEVNGLLVWDATLAAETDAAMRGMFVPRVTTSFDDVTDGLSHTVMLGEIATDLNDNDVRTRAAAGPGEAILRDDPDWASGQELIDPERPGFWLGANTKLQSNVRWGRGLRWADGMPLYSGCNTILPPNREVALHSDRDDCWGIVPPSSRHLGGVNLCFGDGSVRFVTDSIDAGDSRAPSVYVGSPNAPGSQSPYGLWGALGTRASGELKWDHQ